MKTHCQYATMRRAGFSFIEAILTIAIIGIMGSMIVSAITNASRDAQRIVARQQQASVQAAVNSWVMSQTRDTTTGQVKSVKSIRDLYNAQPTSKARFSLLSPSTTGVGGFLDKTTSDHILGYTDNTDRVESSALEAGKQHLELPDWVDGGFPQVLLITR
jgi:type II secretory pathway pseudopilin PulG